MFYGEHTHTLDDKGRLILPARFRDIAKDRCMERFFLTRGLDQCVFMFPENEWLLIEQKFKNMSFMKSEQRAFNRVFFSGAIDVEPDKQGRFIIPQYLKDFAGIVQKTILIGVSNRIEIWDEKIWSQFYTQSSESFEKIAENLLDV